MIRGTTPSLLYNLPFPSSLLKSAEITIKYEDGQKILELTKTLEECVLGETSIAAHLTQEETLQFPAPSSVLVQLRVLTVNDEAMATDYEEVPVKKLLKEGVIV